MRNKIIRFEKLHTWDILSLSIYFTISLYVFFISLNQVGAQKELISAYAFITPLFLYLFNYKSLRNATVFIIWMFFSIFHLWLYVKIKNVSEFDFINGHAADGLNYIWAFLLYFLLARTIHLRTLKIELVAPAWGSSIDIHDNRKIGYWDYLFFFIFFIVWVIIGPIIEK